MALAMARPWKHPKTGIYWLRKHRFKTLGRRPELMSDIANAITGHHRKTVADSYGEFPIEALYRELCKIPKIKIE